METRTIQDLKLDYNIYEDNYDLVFENGGFAFDESLETSLIADFTTNARSENLPSGYRSGNIYFDFGSELWTQFDFSILDNETMQNIEKECINIMQKYVGEEIIKNFEITVEKLNLSCIVITIKTIDNNDELNVYKIPLSKTGE